jgi:hypothetical protein
MNLFLATRPFTGLRLTGRLLSLKTSDVRLLNTIWVFNISYLILAPPIRWISPLNKIMDLGKAGRKSNLSNY